MNTTQLCIEKKVPKIHSTNTKKDGEKHFSLNYLEQCTQIDSISFEYLDHEVMVISYYRGVHGKYI